MRKVGATGRDANVSANAALMAAAQRRAYGLHSAVPQPPPIQQTYSSMAMSMGNLGMSMTMSNMDSTIPRFASPLLPPSQGESVSASFWRSTAMLDAQQQQPQQHYKQTGLDLEFNDFLGGGGREGSTLGMNAHAQNGSVDPPSGSTDVNMSDVSSSFQVPSFANLSSLSGPSSVAPLSMTHSLMQGGQRHQPGPSSSASTSPTSDASSTRSAATSAAMGSSVARPAVPVVAATGAPDANDYSRFVDSTEEPDLSQQKIEQKNEKCQYHNCPNRARVSQAYGKFCNRHVIVAPCGFPGCRDKALLHSSMCDKHLAEGKEALHRILANRAQNVPVCRTFGCFKNDQGRGYCRGHEKLLMATGRLPKHINKRRLNSAYTMCSYPNCNKHSQRNHLCRTHGNVILKQAEEIAKQSTTGESFEDALARLQKEIRRCSHPTCTKNSQRDRLCTMHYYEKHNLSRDGSAPRDDSQLSGTDGGGESDVDTAACTVSGCTLNAHSSRGLCKYHSGQITSGAGGTPSSRRGDDGEGGRNHPICSITGCGNVAPYASGLCQHHGNKTNQAIQITRMNPHSPAVGPTASAMVCSVATCQSSALPGSNVCQQHSSQRHASTKSDLAASRPSLAETSPFHAQGGSTGFLGTLNSTDPSSSFTSGIDRFGSSGATGRMANLSMSSGFSSSTAESDARQALVTLNTAGKQSDSRSGYTGSSTCTNPICTRESYGREFCESCQNIFSPLVVSVGDGNSSSPYQFPSLGGSSQAIQPEPETDAMWGDSSQMKMAVSKTRDLCRVKDCSGLVVRGGLCDNHFRLFQSGSLSVDELTLRSTQLRDEKQRAMVSAAAAAASEMKQGGSPKVKKYFCKVDGCDKQAQKRGLCKRHFRIQEGNSIGRELQSSASPLGEGLDQAMSSYQSQGCRFPACFESVNGGSTLCPAHCKASFCWQSGCENLVESPQFCEYHSYRRECAYEGCSFGANRDGSGCINHAMERRCSHEYCEQFALERSDRCRLHQDDCSQQPCSLCELHGLRERGAFLSRDKAFVGILKSGNPSMDLFHGGSNDFVDERELTRDSVFGDGRLL